MEYFKVLLITLLISFSNYAIAQTYFINDDFEDGDIVGWTAVNYFEASTQTPINGTYSLKNTATSAGNDYVYHSLSGLNLSVATTTWRFQLKNTSFDPSTNNKFWVYLIANETNLNGTSVDGYAVGVNMTGSSDLLTIWEVTDEAVSNTVVQSTFDWDNGTVGIEVTRTNTGTWELKYDDDGGFDNLVSAGTGVNTTYTDASYFGLSFYYSSTRAGLLKMDDVQVSQPSSVYSSESDIVLNSTFTEPSNIDYTSYLENDLTSSSLEVAGFNIRDGGNNDDADNVGTILTDITFNVTNWENIKRLAIYDGTTEIAEVTVSSATVTFSSLSGLSTTDFGTKTFTLRASFNTTVTDNQQFQFTITSATADGSNGSVFAAADAGGAQSTIVSDENRIEVTATALSFLTQPLDENVNNCMTSDVQVEAIDTYSNRDLDFSSGISITSTGTLSSTPIVVNASSGVATFSGADCIEHTATGTNLVLTAERDGSGDWDVDSDPFDISAINACGLEEFNAGTTAPTGWTFTNIGGTYTTATNYGLNSPSLKLDNTGDQIITASVSSPAELSFWIKGQSTDASSALLVEGFDGSWQTIENITNLPTTGTTKTYNSGISTYTKFRFTYTKSIGNLAFDDIYVNCVSCAEPTTDATDFVISNITNNSMDLDWTNGNGIQRIIVCRAGGPVTFTPVDNTTYTANSDYSLATEVGTVGAGNKVIFNGSGNNMTVTGLLPGTIYYFTIYEYSCVPPTEDYYTSGTPAEGHDTTLIDNVNNFTLECITGTTATLNWDSPEGSYDGVLIAVRESTNSPSDPNCLGSGLTNPVTDFSTADVYCGNSTTSKYVYNATGTTVTITGLTKGADYVFKAFTYLDEQWSNGSQISKTAILPDVSNEHSSPGNTIADIYWENPTTCFDEIMVVGKQGNVPSVAPSGDGTTYTANTAFGSGTDLGGGGGEYVVYKGTNTHVNVTALTNTQDYCFMIYVRKGTEWSQGVSTCVTPADVTIFNPGELVIIGYDANVGGTKDSIFLATFVDIKPGTNFLYVNSRYEAGAPANVRTDRWYGGGDSPTTDPGIIRFTYSAAAGSNIPAGSIISFAISGLTAQGIRVNGTLEPNITNVNETGVQANIHTTDGDQIWLLQGTFTDQGDYYTLEGNVLWGITNNADWVPVDQPVSFATDGTGRESRLHPDLECFNASFPSGQGYIFYLNSSVHNDTKRNLLMAIMDNTNWSGDAGTAAMDFNADFTNPYNNGMIGKPFTIIPSGIAEGTWIGGVPSFETDWFTCGNWQSLAVPDKEIDVLIPNTTYIPDINYTSLKAANFNYIAECNNLVIDNGTLIIEGTRNDSLFVYGSLTIQNSGVLDMDDGTTAPDGVITVSEDWTNNSTFNHGDGVVIFDGTDEQFINSSTDETFNILQNYNTNILGLTINNNVTIGDTLLASYSRFSLNSYDLTLSGPYIVSGVSYFIGEETSNMTINGTGDVNPLRFITDTTLNDILMNRVGDTALIKSSIVVKNNMTISNGALALGAGKFFTVDNNIVNTVGTAGLIIKSDATGTASLIHNTADVPASCERFFNGNNWHYIFSPLSNVTISQLTTTSGGFDNPNFYYYDEVVADFWQGSTLYVPMGWQTMDHSGIMDTTLGYIVFDYTDRTYTLTGGNLYTGNKIFTLSYTDNGTGTEPTTGLDWNQFEGWNLFGNPYASAIDWDNIGIDKTNIYDVVYYYDDVADVYKYYGGGTIFDQGITVNGGSRYIPANQAFFVKALSSADGASFVIPSSARIHSLKSVYKKNTTSAEVLKFAIYKNDYSDETAIITTENKNVVAFKMFSWNKTKPQIFTLNPDLNQLFAINNCDIRQQNIIPVGFSLYYPGDYDIQFINNTYNDQNIYLEDKTTGIVQNIRKSSSYHFNEEDTGVIANRFNLIFKKNTAPIQILALADQTIYVDENWTYKLPKNLFFDYDTDDELTITASLEDGSPLPDWITYSENGFSGATDIPQTLKIKLTAKDLCNSEISAIFKLTVLDQTLIKEYNNNTSIYPNPASDMITITLPVGISNAEMRIFDITGVLVFQTNLKNNITNQKLVNLSAGTYNVEIKFGNITVRKLMLIR